MIKDIDSNKVYISNQLEKKYSDTFRRLTALFSEEGVEWDTIPHTNDIWVRDYMPIQIGDNDFLLYRYEPDYLLDDPKRKATITDASFVCNSMDIRHRVTDIKIDGGNVTLCGEYVVMTDKVFVENNKEKNDEAFKKQLEAVLRHKIIFMPWHCINPKDEDSDVYGHSDGFVHWCGGNKVMMSNHRNTDPKEASEIRRIMESFGFEVTEMLFDVPHPEPLWNWAYINYLQVGNLIVMPVFGIEEDKQALEYIKALNPNCKIRQMRLRDIAANGGALHCITWNIKCQ